MLHIYEIARSAKTPVITDPTKAAKFFLKKFYITTQDLVLYSYQETNMCSLPMILYWGQYVSMPEFGP